MRLRLRSEDTGTGALSGCVPHKFQEQCEVVWGTVTEVIAVRPARVYYGWWKDTAAVEGLSREHDDIM